MIHTIKKIVYILPKHYYTTQYVYILSNLIDNTYNIQNANGGNYYRQIKFVTKESTVHLMCVDLTCYSPLIRARLDTTRPVQYLLLRINYFYQFIWWLCTRSGRELIFLMQIYLLVHLYPPTTNQLLSLRKTSFI